MGASAVPHAPPAQVRSTQTLPGSGQSEAVSHSATLPEELLALVLLLELLDELVAPPVPPPPVPDVEPPSHPATHATPNKIQNTPTLRDARP
ncbi:MAG: hypothetical protein QM820_33585 [Minicystis sp.]